MPRIRTVEGSCWACKERRVICDLSSPCCNKCASSGRVCDYGKVRLRWTDCVASRGRLAGQKVPLSRPLALRQNSDSHLLYFEHELLPRFNLSNTVPRVDLARLAGDPLILRLIAVIGNSHQTNRSPSMDIVPKSQDRSFAIKMFRKKLTDTQSDKASSSLFLANVLLCMLDGIIEKPSNNDTAPHLHLVGGKAILKNWGGVREIFELKQELPILMLSIFATMDLTHALLIGEAPYFEFSNWAELGSFRYPWWGKLQADDDFLETMAVFSQLATLGHGVCNLKQAVPIGVLLSIQMALEQTQRGTNVEDNREDKKSWNAFCSCYRYAASIYLYRALSGLSVSHPLVQQSVFSVMEILAGNDLTPNLYHCILFPLLIVGSHCLRGDQRVEVKKGFNHTAGYLSFGSLRGQVEFLEKLWVNVDNDSTLMESSWWEYFDEIAKATCLF